MIFHFHVRFVISFQPGISYRNETHYHTIWFKQTNKQRNSNLADLLFIIYMDNSQNSEPPKNGRFIEIKQLDDFGVPQF